MTAENDGSQFDRLPATEAERQVPERPTRTAVLDWWDERLGIPADTFAAHTFWEKGKGKVWAYAGEAADPIAIETLGLPILRTRSKFWKPTTNAAQRFGHAATQNCIALDDDAAARFLAGEDQPVPWDGDQGYVIATHILAGRQEPIGVGLWLDGELQSLVPKSRRQSRRRTD
jgi:NOL1/NOP2/fmu family ribosome biogenesis protein